MSLLKDIFKSICYSVLYSVLLWHLISARQTLRTTPTPNSNSQYHLSIAIAKSSTIEMPDRVYTKLGMHFRRYTLLTFFSNRGEMGQNGPHQANHSKLWEYQKCFLFMYRCTKLRNLQEPFIWMLVYLVLYLP